MAAILREQEPFQLPSSQVVEVFGPTENRFDLSAQWQEIGNSMRSGDCIAYVTGAWQAEEAMLADVINPDCDLRVIYPDLRQEMGGYPMAQPWARERAMVAMHGANVSADNPAICTDVPLSVLGMLLKAAQARLVASLRKEDLELVTTNECYKHGGPRPSSTASYSSRIAQLKLKPSHFSGLLLINGLVLLVAIYMSPFARTLRRDIRRGLNKLLSRAKPAASETSSEQSEARVKRKSLYSNSSGAERQAVKQANHALQQRTHGVFVLDDVFPKSLTESEWRAEVQSQFHRVATTLNDVSQVVEAVHHRLEHSAQLAKAAGFKVGQRYSHDKHGLGTVERTQADGLVVMRFDSGDTHKYKPTSLHKLHAVDSGRGHVSGGGASSMGSSLGEGSSTGSQVTAQASSLAQDKSAAATTEVAATRAESQSDGAPPIATAEVKVVHRW